MSRDGVLPLGDRRSREREVWFGGPQPWGRPTRRFASS